MRDFNVVFTEANMAAFCNGYKIKALNLLALRIT